MASATSFGDANAGFQAGIINGPVNAEFRLPPERPETPPRPSAVIPFGRDADFVERREILDQLQTKCAGPGSRAALVGLGGVGKSQLAIEYAHRMREQSPETWVFWVHASTRARCEEAYRDIADRLKLPGRNNPKSNIFKLVRDWLCDESNGRWMMVLDNADDIKVFYPKRNPGESDDDGGMAVSLATFLPQSHNGTILVTSRSRDAAVRLVGNSKRTISVQVMDNNQARQLLRNKLEDTSNESDMADLVNALGHIPLAISQAAAYINRGARMTISRYLEEFWKNDRKKGSLLNRDTGDLRRDDNASNSVAITWQLSFEQIRRERRSAADLLSLMSFFNPQAIPEAVLRAHTARVVAGANSGILNGKDSEDSGFDDDLDILLAFSLVKTTADSEVCEMHQLVQFCMREWLSSFNEAERWKREFIRLMVREFPPGSFINWIRCQTLFPHIAPMFENEPSQEELLEDWAQVLSYAGWYLWTKGQYKEAESIVTKAVRALERTIGQRDSGMLSSMSILALALQGQGKYKAAEEMNRRALEGYEKALGNEHPNTLTSINNLGSILQSQGKSEAAEEMNRRALKGREKVFGEEHPSTLTSINNLALVLQDQGKYKAAEEMNQRALEGKEKVLGKEHPSTLTSINNLALVLRSQGRYEEAEEMNRIALKGREKALGKEHPSTLTSMINLASVLRYQGKYEVAEEMNRRALEGYEKALGKEHPDTLTCVGGLALVLQDQGKYEAAEEMNRRALEEREKVLGKDHPNTLISIHNLALVLRDQEKYDAAEEMSRRALEKREKVLGRTHPDTLYSVYCLAHLLSYLHRYEEALPLFQIASSGYTESLGSDH